MYGVFYNFFKRPLGYRLFTNGQNDNTPSPPESVERITQEGIERITEDGDMRITE